MSEEYKDIQQVDFFWERPENGFMWDDKAEPVPLTLGHRYPDSGFALSEVPGLRAMLQEALEQPYPDEALSQALRSAEMYQQSVPPQVEGPFLIEAPGATGWYRHNRLLQDETTMFTQFAETSPDQQGILEFANKYGMLTRGETEVTTTKFSSGSEPVSCRQWLTVDNQPKVPTLPAESLAFWQREIIEMGRLFKVWKWATNTNKTGRLEPDYASIQRVISWTDDGRVVKYQLPVYLGVDNPGFTSGTLADTHEHPEIFKRFKRDNPLLPAQFLVQHLTNKKMGDLEDKGIASIRPRLLMNTEDKTGPYLRPSNLLAALWLQFYQAFIGERCYKRCAYFRCGKWEDVTAKRSDWTMHEFCSNSKRQAEYRKRNPKEAKEKAPAKKTSKGV